MSKAKERALEVFPIDVKATQLFGTYDVNLDEREAFRKGYEQAEKDIFAIVKEYLEKGLRCMDQSYEDESQIYTFWDGFHNCAESILRELDEEKPSNIKNVDGV